MSGTILGTTDAAVDKPKTLPLRAHVENKTGVTRLVILSFFDAIVNGIVFLISLFDSSLLGYKYTMDFCMFTSLFFNFTESIHSNSFLGRRVYRNNYKGHMDNNKGGGNRGERRGSLGWWGEVGRKGRNLYLNNKNQKCF